MRDYHSLHLDTNSNKRTACSEKGYGCKWTWELSNITLGHKFSKGTACSKKGYGCRWTWETNQHYTRTQIQVKEQLVVRKDVDVNEHERLSNIIAGHKFK